MSIINVKLRQREKNKYRKIVSTDETIYESVSTIINSSSPYAAGATLEEGEWFYVENAKNQPYALEVLDHNFESVDFDSLDRNDFGKTSRACAHSVHFRTYRMDGTRFTSNTCHTYSTP